MAARLTVTRISNACCLIRSAHHAVLTDPWFTEHWHLHRGEPLGLTVSSLPQLSCIVASHYFSNHWDMKAMAHYPHRATTPVLVCTEKMVNQALAAGFKLARRVIWGEVVQVAPGLRVEVVEAHASQKENLNSYVLTMDGVRVFFGGEARDLEPLQSYASLWPAVDIALLPVNGLKVLGGRKLVMGPRDALEGARILKARTLGCIHDATGKDPAWSFIRRTGGTAETQALARQRGDSVWVVALPTGSATILD